MNNPAAKKAAALAAVTIDWLDGPTHPTVRVREDGEVIISGEDGKYLVDYWNEFGDGCPKVHPELEAAIEKLGLTYEWEHPGAIVIYPR